MHVGDVHFDEGNSNAEKRISERDAGVGQSTGVDKYGCDSLTLGEMNTLNDAVFSVALEEVKLMTRRLSQSREADIDIFERVRSVDFRLTRAQQIEIGSVKHEKMCHVSVLCGPWQGIQSEIIS